MNRQYVIDLAINASVERGCPMYIIYDSCDKSYSFTQERDMFLYNGQHFVYIVDGHNVNPY